MVGAGRVSEGATVCVSVRVAESMIPDVSVGVIVAVVRTRVAVDAEEFGCDDVSDEFADADESPDGAGGTGGADVAWGEVGCWVGTVCATGARLPSAHTPPDAARTNHTTNENTTATLYHIA